MLKRIKKSVRPRLHLSAVLTLNKVPHFVLRLDDMPAIKGQDNLHCALFLILKVLIMCHTILRSTTPINVVTGMLIWGVFIIFVTVL